jgi:DNA-binding transcriptional ArsR family regulator
LNDEIQGVNELVFMPSTHIGPYVTVSKDNTRVEIVFRARMPEGTPSHSPQLDRSDLLVRLGALADDTRMQILNLLLDYEELCAPQVIKLLGLSQSAASRHLRQLSATGFLTERRHEGAKCYSLNQRRIEDVIQALQDHLLS